MPRVRPEDFFQLDSPRDGAHPWARWWRHRDGSVSHVHYRDSGEVIRAWRHDREPSRMGLFAPAEERRS